MENVLYNLVVFAHLMSAQPGTPLDQIDSFVVDFNLSYEDCQTAKAEGVSALQLDDGRKILVPDGSRVECVPQY